MSVRGNARQHPPTHERPAHRFHKAAHLVKWHLTTGRASFGGQRAIRYDSDGGARDVFRANQGHGLFALTTLCLRAIKDERRALVLAMAFGEGLSDQRIAERLQTSETSIRTARNRGLRDVEDAAHRLALEAHDRTGQTLLPEEE